MSSCREIRQALGVYVLGAIDPAERAQVDEHLATCPDCREELASLAGLPAMLRKVPLVEAERLAAPDAEPGMTEVPSEEMLESLVARTANVRRMNRWRRVAAAAAVVILALGGGVAVGHALQPSAPASPTFHWHTALGGAGGVHLTVMYRPVESGTWTEANVSGVAQGTLCQLRAVDGHGHAWSLGSWRYVGGSAWYPGSVGVSGPDIHTFELTVGGKVIASAPA
jgi:predicted anti-sigma-YlaC factor YlaD